MLKGNGLTDDEIIKSGVDEVTHAYGNSKILSAIENLNIDTEVLSSSYWLTTFQVFSCLQLFYTDSMPMWQQKFGSTEVLNLVSTDVTKLGNFYEEL